MLENYKKDRGKKDLSYGEFVESKLDFGSIFPIKLLDDNERNKIKSFIENRCKELLECSHGTIFLGSINTEEIKKYLITDLESAENLLFLDNIDKARFNIEGKDVIVDLKPEKIIRDEKRDVTIFKSHPHTLKGDEYIIANWKDKIKLAFKIVGKNGNGNLYYDFEKINGKLYTYLPLRQESGKRLHFHIHSNFETTQGRDGIVANRNDVNTIILNQLPEAITDIFKVLLSEERFKFSVYNIIPRWQKDKGEVANKGREWYNDYPKQWKKLVDSMRDFYRNEAFIPCYYVENGELKKDRLKELANPAESFYIAEKTLTKNNMDIQSGYDSLNYIVKKLFNKINTQYKNYKLIVSDSDIIKVKDHLELFGSRKLDTNRIRILISQVNKNSLENINDSDIKHMINGLNIFKGVDKEDEEEYDPRKRLPLLRQAVLNLIPDINSKYDTEKLFLDEDTYIEQIKDLYKADWDCLSFNKFPALKGYNRFGKILKDDLEIIDDEDCGSLEKLWKELFDGLLKREDDELFNKDYSTLLDLFFNYVKAIKNDKNSLNNIWSLINENPDMIRININDEIVSIKRLLTEKSLWLQCKLPEEDFKETWVITETINELINIFLLHLTEVIEKGIDSSSIESFIEKIPEKHLLAKGFLKWIDYELNKENEMPTWISKFKLKTLDGTFRERPMLTKKDTFSERYPKFREVLPFFNQCIVDHGPYNTNIINIFNEEDIGIIKPEVVSNLISGIWSLTSDYNERKRIIIELIWYLNCISKVDTVDPEIVNSIFTELGDVEWLPNEKTKKQAKYCNLYPVYFDEEYRRQHQEFINKYTESIDCFYSTDEKLIKKISGFNYPELGEMKVWNLSDFEIWIEKKLDVIVQEVNESVSFDEDYEKKLKLLKKYNHFKDVDSERVWNLYVKWHITERKWIDAEDAIVINKRVDYEKLTREIDENWLFQETDKNRYELLKTFAKDHLTIKNNVSIPRLIKFTKNRDENKLLNKSELKNYLSEFKKIIHNIDEKGVANRLKNKYVKKIGILNENGELITSEDSCPIIFGEDKRIRKILEQINTGEGKKHLMADRVRTIFNEINQTNTDTKETHSNLYNDILNKFIDSFKFIIYDNDSFLESDSFFKSEPIYVEIIMDDDLEEVQEYLHELGYEYTNNIKICSMQINYTVKVQEKIFEFIEEQEFDSYEDREKGIQYISKEFFFKVDKEIGNNRHYRKWEEEEERKKIQRDERKQKITPIREELIDANKTLSGNLIRMKRALVGQALNSNSTNKDFQIIMESKNHDYVEKAMSYIEEHPELIESMIESSTNEQGYDETTIIREILQNAEDAYSQMKNKDKKRKITFKFSDDCLDVIHYGRRFNEVGINKYGNNQEFDDISQILSTGTSHQKKESKISIGKFGRGFNSVYNITKRPLIGSYPYYFGIKYMSIPESKIPERKQADNEIFPGIDGLAENEDLQRVTRIKLKVPRGSDFKDRWENLKEDLKNIDENYILFLNLINEINFLFENKSPNFRISKEVIKTIPEIGIIVRTKNGNSIKNWFVINQETSFNTDSKENEKIQYSLAFPWDVENELFANPVIKSPLCIFLPTKKQTGLPFIIHGQFGTSSSRNFELDSRFNRKLIESVQTTYKNTLISFLRKWQEKPDSIRNLYCYLPNQESTDPLLKGFCGVAKNVLQEEFSILTIENKVISYRNFRTASDTSREFIRFVRKNNLYKRRTNIIDKESYEILLNKKEDYITKTKNHVTLQSFVTDKSLFNDDIFPYLLFFSFNKKDIKGNVRDEVDTLLNKMKQTKSLRSLNGKLNKPDQLLLGGIEDSSIFGKDRILDFNHYFDAVEKSEDYKKWVISQFKEWGICAPNNQHIVDLIKELSKDEDEELSRKLLEYLSVTIDGRTRWETLDMLEKIFKISDLKWIPLDYDFLSLKDISEMSLWETIKDNEPFDTIPINIISVIRKIGLDDVSAMQATIPIIEVKNVLTWPTYESAKEGLRKNIKYLINWWGSFDSTDQDGFKGIHHLTSNYGAYIIALKKGLKKDSWETALDLNKIDDDTKLAWFWFLSISTLYQGIETNNEVHNFVQDIEKNGFFDIDFNCDNSANIFWKKSTDFIKENRWNHRISLMRRFVDITYILYLLISKEKYSLFNAERRKIYMQKLIKNEGIYSFPQFLYEGAREAVKSSWLQDFKNEKVDIRKMRLGESLKVRAFFITRELCRLGILKKKYDSEAFFAPSGLRKQLFNWGLLDERTNNPKKKWGNDFSAWRQLATQMTEEGKKYDNQDYDIPFNAYYFEFCLVLQQCNYAT